VAGKQHASRTRVISTGTARSPQDAIWPISTTMAAEAKNKHKCSAIKSESAGAKVDQPNRKALVRPNQTEGQRHNVHAK